MSNNHTVRKGCKKAIIAYKLVIVIINHLESLEKLIALLENALIEARKPNTNVHEVAQAVKDGIEDVINPNKALEFELARLVDAKTPPNGEFYKTRTNRKELTVAFFHRVYGRFYDAGVLYSHQLRTIDRCFYDNLLKAKDRPNLPQKKDMVDRDLTRISNIPALKLPSLAVASRRRVSAA